MKACPAGPEECRWAEECWRGTKSGPGLGKWVSGVEMQGEPRERFPQGPKGRDGEIRADKRALG